MFKKLSQIMAVCVATLLAVTAIFPSPAFADSANTVTLGADLTDDEQATVLEFFGLTEDDLDSMQVIEVTNDEEREYLSDYISSDIIGTKTISCSYIEPTSSGGINVETANLTYVTKNTIYNALQTAGIENCNVVVTAPYAVSGTGALTGIFLAYEASGESLDEDKEAAATEELVESAALEDEYGEDVASVISDVKNDVTSSDEDLSSDEISDIVEQYASEKGLSLSDDAIQTITDIAERVQDLDYDSDAFSTTLDDIKNSISNSSNGILGVIQNFFEQIGEWISNLISAITGNDNSSDNTSDTESTEEHSTEGILGNLNTDVFELDDTSSSDTEDGSSSDTTDGTTETTDASDSTTDSETDVNDTADSDTDFDSTTSDSDATSSDVSNE